MKITTIILIFCILPSVLLAQNNTYVVLKPGKSIKVDGAASNNEWNDADSLVIKMTDHWVSTVYYKFDGSHLLFAFKNLAQETGKDCVVDLLIDLLNNKSNEWDSNDLWIHSSYSNCEAKGKYFDWSTCAKTKPDWLANNLPFVSGNANIEMQIDISKINNETHSDTLGFCLYIHHEDIKGYWPVGADYTKPSTWGKMTISKDFKAIIKND